MDSTGSMQMHPILANWQNPLSRRATTATAKWGGNPREVLWNISSMKKKREAGDQVHLGQTPVSQT